LHGFEDAEMEKGQGEWRIMVQIGCRCPMHLQDIFLRHVRGFKAQEVPADWLDQLMAVGSLRGGSSGGDCKDKGKGKGKMQAAAADEDAPWADEDAAWELEERQGAARGCWIDGQQQQLRRLFQFRRRRASSQQQTCQQQSLPAPARGCWGIWHQLLVAAGKRLLGVACWLLPVAYCMQQTATGSSAPLLCIGLLHQKNIYNSLCYNFRAQLFLGDVPRNPFRYFPRPSRSS
jgi:hypothetical protein